MQVLYVDCIFSVYTPNEDMALASIVHKEVDVTRDPRLRDHVSQSESLRSTDSDVSDKEDTKPYALSGAKRDVGKEIDAFSLSTARVRDTSRRKSSRTKSNGRSNKNYVADAGEHNGLNGAFESVDGKGPLNSRKEMQPLQLQNTSTTTAAKKQSRPEIETKSSIKSSKKKGKEDLDEILRKRLAKLEAKLSAIGSENSAHRADEFVEDFAKDTAIRGGKRMGSVNSRAEKKRKVHSQSNDGDGKFAKRFKASSDEETRIIAANIDASMTSSSGAKFDKYDQINADEGLSMSADLADQMTSVIQSHLWDYAQTSDFGKMLSSSDAQQLIDTETIMLNVLSQNLSDSSPTHPQAPNTITDVLPEVVDNNTAISPQRSVQPKLESSDNGRDLEHHEEGKHLGCLSVDTQFDSQFVESFAVKSTHLNSVRDWRNKKMLDLLISGRLKEIPVGTSSEVQHEGTDRLVAGSLQHILNNLSWLWSVAVGDNMLDSVHDVVSSTANNLDSLVIDFVEDSGCVDIPLSVHLSTDHAADDVSDTEGAAEQEIQKEDDWSQEESLLLGELASSLDEARDKVLNQKHAVNSGENMYPDVSEDLYDPTRPTEMDHASSSGDSDAQRLKRASQTFTENELQLSQNAAVSDTLSELVENSAPSRRTVRIHKKETVTATSPSDRIKRVVHKDRRGNSGSKMKGLPVSEPDLEHTSSRVSDIGFANDKPVAGRISSDLSVSEEVLIHQSIEMTNIMETEIATDGLPSKQTNTDKQPQRTKSTDVTDVTGGFDLSVESQLGMDTIAASVASHKAKSSKKHFIGHDEVSGKSRRYRTASKKGSRSRKHKERSVVLSGKTNKKEIHDIDRQLKLHVKSELNHVQKTIESLLCDEYGITIENAGRISRKVSLHAVDIHFPILSGISADAMPASVLGEKEVGDMLKTLSLTPMLNDILTELNIPLSIIHLTLPENASTLLTDRVAEEKKSVELNRAQKTRIESPSSPPTMRRSAVKQTAVPRRNKSTDEACVSIIPHRRQETEFTEDEKRLMKADKLMQTFRRSQIAKRQNRETSTQPSAAFMRQVQTVTPSEGLKPTRPEAVDDEKAMSFLAVKEPDFSMVITDGSMLASVELPQVLPKLLLPQSDVDTSVLSQPSSSELPLAAEAVHISTPSVPVSEITVSSCRTVVTSVGKEQSIYLFNSDTPLCREVQVCIECVFLIFY